MPGVYCERCGTNVILEQDGKSCSNCGAVLVRPILQGPEMTQEPNHQRLRKPARKPARSAA